MIINNNDGGGGDLVKWTEGIIVCVVEQKLINDSATKGSWKNNNGAEHNERRSTTWGTLFLFSNYKGSQIGVKLTGSREPSRVGNDHEL